MVNYKIISFIATMQRLIDKISSKSVCTDAFSELRKL